MPEHIEQVRALLGNQAPYDKFPMQFGANFGSKETRYHAHASLRPSRKGKDYELLYHCIPVAVKGIKKLKPVEALLESLAPLKLVATFGCEVSFVYPSSAWKSIITLPLRLLEMPTAPFTEISGIRAVKLGVDNRLSYSVILDIGDRREGDSISYSQLVMFEYESLVEKGFADKILAEAVKISLSFLYAKE
jgi:hypothetical protein